MVAELTPEKLEEYKERFEEISRIIDLWGRLLEMRPLSTTELNLSAGAGTNDLEFDRVKPGRVFIVYDFAAWDDTSSPTRIRLGFYNGRRNQWHRNQPAPIISESVYLSGPLILWEGMYMVARIEGATSGDDLYATVNGYEILLGPRW